MILIDIDNADATNMTLAKIEKKIQNAWIKNSRVYLKFRKPIYKEVYTRLLKYELREYYDHFVELGAKSNEDFEFVEYDDLVKMNMNRPASEAMYTKPATVLTHTEAPPHSGAQRPGQLPCSRAALRPPTSAPRRPVAPLLAPAPYRPAAPPQPYA